MCFRGGKAPMLTTATTTTRPAEQSRAGLVANENNTRGDFRWQCSRQLVVVVDWRGIGGVEGVKSFPSRKLEAVQVLCSSKPQS